MLKKLLLTSFFVTSLSVGAYAAEDEGLYPAAPPADAGFVRVVNDTTDSRADITLSGMSLGDVTGQSISDYAVLKQGDVDVKFGDISKTQSISAGEYYTAFSMDDAVMIVDDQKIIDPKKAVIALYNLSDLENVSLVSTTHNADIFKDVAKGKKDAREINAVTIGVSVKNGDESIKDIAELKLERQIASSLFLVGENGNYDVVVKNSENLK